MPVNKNAFARYIAIDNLLKTGRGYSWTALASACENDTLGYAPSKSTILHDLGFMRKALHAPVICREGLYFYDGKFSIFNFIPDDEIVALLSETVVILRELPDLGLSEPIELLVNKAVYDSGIKSRLIHLSKNRYLKGSDILGNLYKSLKSGKRMMVQYRDFKGEKCQFDLHPLLLKEYRHRWFLYGWLDSENRFHNCAIDRIESFEPTQMSADKSSLPHLLDELNNIIGVTLLQESSLTTIQFSAVFPAMNYIKTKPLHHTQMIVEESADRAVFSIAVRPNYEMYQLLLSYGNQVEILEPAAIRQNIKKIVAGMNKTYAKETRINHLNN